MNGLAILILFIGFIMAIICFVAFISMLIAAAIKKSKKLMGFAFVPIGFFVVMVMSFLVWDYAKRKRFDSIPYLQVNENTVTVLNFGTGSMGSGSKYVMAEEDSEGNIVILCKEHDSVPYAGNIYAVDPDSALEETGRPRFNYNSSRKFGYTFTSKKAGTVYLAVAESDCGKWAYTDIYKIVIDDDLSVEAENIKHIDYDYDSERLMDEIPYEYPFVDIFEGLN